MKTNPETELFRYVVYADGEVIGWSFDKKKAEFIAFKCEMQCLNQDIPFQPKIEIVKE